METEQPLVVIAGPTASGKSELAMKLAERFNGEIICADSRTIYKNMDIGTAKPTKLDQKAITHHLLDVIEPGELFSVYDFQQQAKAAINAIRSSGKLPIMVGGTGLYIDSVVFDYEFPQKADRLRSKFANNTIEELQEYCNNNNIILPQNQHNRRHLIAAIERNNNKPRRRVKPLSNTIIVGITTNKEDLYDRITKRAEYIFSHGVVEEAKQLGKVYGWDNESMTANIYKIIYQLDKRELTMAEAINKSIAADQKLVKRQLTWLKRNPFINWYSLSDAETFLFNTLAKAQ